MPFARIAPTSSNPTWNVTDIDLLKLMQYLTLENANGSNADGVTLLTTQFTIAQFIAALNQRQEKFLRDTAAVVVRASQVTTAGIGRYALPSDWIYTRRLTWAGAAPASTIPVALTRCDTFQLDHGMADWQQNTDTPSFYNDGSDLPTLTVEIAKAPANAGQMTLGYVPQPATLNGVVGTPVSLNIPDEYVWPILWGALADLLGSDGPDHDPERAQFCEAMYGIGVDMARAMLEGLS